MPTNQVSNGLKITYSRFVCKRKAAGGFKARVMARGGSQKEGIDYSKTFTLVGRIGSHRIQVAIANSEHGWPVHQVDVKVGFLQRPIEGEVYYDMAPGREATGYKTGVHMVMKAKGSLFGLAQSPAL